jgi:outer membrane biosynthesis protein TonB
MVKLAIAASILTAVTAAEADKLDAPTIQRVMRLHLPAFRRCYVKRSPDAKPSGGLGVTFTIGTRGKVTSTKIRSGDDAVDTCLDKALRAVAFPPPDAPVTITYPFASDPT